MSASCFNRAGKSCLIIARCGQVWLPMGSPSGLARKSVAHAARNPATAASAAVFRKNSRLDIAGMHLSSVSGQIGISADIINPLRLRTRNNRR